MRSSGTSNSGGSSSSEGDSSCGPPGGGLAGDALGSRAASCRIPGCQRKLQMGYQKKSRVCQVHSQAPSLELNGVTVRFCQQCGRMHPLTEFDPGRRSCRNSLERHRLRRRVEVQQKTRPRQQQAQEKKKGDGQEACGKKRKQQPVPASLPELLLEAAAEGVAAAPPAQQKPKKQKRQQQPPPPQQQQLLLPPAHMPSAAAVGAPPSPTSPAPADSPAPPALAPTGVTMNSSAPPLPPSAEIKWQLPQPGATAGAAKAAAMAAAAAGPPACREPTTLLPQQLPPAATAAILPTVRPAALPSLPPFGAAQAAAAAAPAARPALGHIHGIRLLPADAPAAPPMLRPAEQQRAESASPAPARWPPQAALQAAQQQAHAPHGRPQPHLVQEALRILQSTEQLDCPDMPSTEELVAINGELGLDLRTAGAALFGTGAPQLPPPPPLPPLQHVRQPPQRAQQQQQSQQQQSQLPVLRPALGFPHVRRPAPPPVGRSAELAAGDLSQQRHVLLASTMASTSSGGQGLGSSSAGVPTLSALQARPSAWAALEAALMRRHSGEGLEAPHALASHPLLGPSSNIPSIGLDPPQWRGALLM